MKIKEIRELSKEELLSRKKILEEEIFNLRIQQANQQLEKPSQIRSNRKEIARINTILKERELQKKVSAQ